MCRNSALAAATADLAQHLAYLELVPICPVAEFEGPIDEMVAKGLIRLADGDVMLTKAGTYCLAESRKRAAEPVAAMPEALTELQKADRERRKAPPMKETAEDRAVSDKAYAVTADELRQFIERFEQLEAEKQDVVSQQKDLISEAKGRGYDTKVMRKLVALRKRKPEDVAEEEAILEMYKAALGMS